MTTTRVVTGYERKAAREAWVPRAQSGLLASDSVRPFPPGRPRCRCGDSRPRHAPWLTLATICGRVTPGAPAHVRLPGPEEATRPAESYLAAVDLTSGAQPNG